VGWEGRRLLCAWGSNFSHVASTLSGIVRGTHGLHSIPRSRWLTIFKQTIYLIMVEIANTYKEPHRSRYVAACKEFRLPYLDYFRPRGGRVEFPGVVNGRMTSFPYDFRLPDIFSVQKVTVRTAPDDVADANFDNPLYTYKFNDATGRLPRDDEASIVSLKLT